jgi:hypothetical protein
MVLAHKFMVIGDYPCVSLPSAIAPALPYYRPSLDICSRLRRKAAARATAFHKRFFAFGETALAPLPALDGMQLAHDPSGTAQSFPKLRRP